MVLSRGGTSHIGHLARDPKGQGTGSRLGKDSSWETKGDEAATLAERLWPLAWSVREVQ